MLRLLPATIRIVIPLLATLALSSCQRSGGNGIPELKEGAYYHITFPQPLSGTSQTIFKVTDTHRGPWVQVEVYGHPEQFLLFGLYSGKASESDTAEMKAKVIENAKKDARLRWLNLSQATSVWQATPDELGILKDL